jgi:hypothetical protein
VYTISVKNITLSADEDLIEQAREAARAQHTTINAAFREWLAEYTSRATRAERIKELFERTSYVRAGRHFSREELNERR